MGHRNSSAHVHDAGGFCVHRSGVAGPAAEHSLKGVSVNGVALKVTSPTGAAAGGAPVWLLLTAIRFYQAVFAPMMPLGCKFYPSCSRYAVEAIARHGAIHGTQLALARLWRCRPFTQGGVDPVPDFLSDGAEISRCEVRS
jgi:putative membrane protein insertion efficiency factor